MLEKKLWVSTNKHGTGQVNVDDKNKITFIPPIWSKFKGRDLKILLNWFRGDGVYVKEL